MWLSSEASTITVTSATLIVWGAREHKASEGQRGARLPPPALAASTAPVLRAGNLVGRFQ
jgi:hypothetical protein